MKKKRFTITASIFDNKYLTALMDFAAFISPAKTKDEQKIREADRKLIAESRLGEPIKKPSANLGGRLDRDKILTATTLFGDRPKVTERDVELMADAGFDFIINGNGGEYAGQVFDWCEKYGLAAIGMEVPEYLSGKNLDLLSADENDDIFSGFTPHPASVGDSLFDEPHTESFHKIAEYHRLYNKYLPGRFAFSNLFPAGAVKSQLGAKSYREYVDRFASEVREDYISADIYPFHPAKIINYFEMMICLDTYHHISEACRRRGRDFWLYIQTQMRWFSHLYTYTTFEMIKWQYYAAIAYGCRSIINASYNPVWGNDAIGIIDYDGNLTEQYLYVKRVNAEIVKLSPVIKDYRSLGVRLFSGRKSNQHFALAMPKQNANNRACRFGGIGTVKNIESESTVLAGYFTNAEGKNALMLVNCRNLYDPYASQTVTVRLTRKFTVSVYEHGELTRTENTDVLTVCPGSCDGVFITLD